jgi:hypothetical protein
LKPGKKLDEVAAAAARPPARQADSSEPNK